MNFLKNKKGIGLGPVWRSIILVGAFSLFIMLFAVFFLNANTNTDISNDPNLGTFGNTSSELSGNLSAIGENTRGIYTALSSDNPDPIMIFLILRSIVKIPFQMVSLIFMISFSLMDFIGTTLLAGSIGTLVLSIIVAVIFGTAVMLIIKLIRIGESEH